MAKPPDKESLYDTSKLSIIFGISSVVLFAVIVWLVIDDHAREWKKYQRSFQQLQFIQAQEELKKTAGKVNVKEMEKLRAELSQAERELAAQIKELKVKVKRENKLSVRLQKISAELQIEKSNFDSVRYAYEETLVAPEEHLVQMKTALEGKKKKLKRELDTWRSRVLANQSLADELTREKEKLDQEIAGFTRTRDELQVKVQQMGDEERRLKKKLAALKPGFFNAFRNSPIFDFMAPSYKIRQLVVEDLYDDLNFVRVPKVDRCITCHTAIDLQGFENAPQPFRTHPKLDLFLGSDSPHPIEKFACTVCHGGNGQALTFYHTGHTPDSEDQALEWEKKYHWHPVKHWEDPMLPMKDVEASCLKCHQGFLEVPQAPKVNEGRQLFDEMGCWGCHKVQGINGLRKVGPDLTNIRGKMDPAWTFKWIKDPKSFRPDTTMPSFFGLTNGASPEEEDVQVGAISAYLYGHSGEFKPGEVTEKGDSEKGKELVTKLGCLGCHALGDVKANEFAPNLSAIGSKLSLPWLVDWLKNPKHYYPETRMPSLRLSDPEAVDIVTYLVSLKNPKFDAAQEPEINKDILSRLVREELRESLTDQEADDKLKSMTEDEEKDYLGGRLIGFYGCFACHNIKGFEDAKEIGTEFTEEGSKLVTQFDFGFLSDLPRTRQAFFHQKLKDPRLFDKGRVRNRKEKLHMPQFNLTDEKREALVTFLTGLRREYIPLSKMRLPNEEEKLVEAGKRIVRDHNCTGCHVLDQGAGGDIAKTVEDPGLAPPSLVGEGKRVQDKWLFDFLVSPTIIRPWLHFRMPTFGFTDDETDTLVKHFRAQDHVPLTFRDAKAKPTAESLAAGKKLFDMFQCMKCHPTGAPAPGTQVSASELAPNLTLARDRLRHEWIIDWLKDPNALMEGTRMPGYFPDMQSPTPDILSGDAMAQITAIRDYVVHIAEETKAETSG